VLERVIEQRGRAPAHSRCENGHELTAEAPKDWCRFKGTSISYIEPGAPWQNLYFESFNGHLGNELLDLELRHRRCESCLSRGDGVLLFGSIGDWFGILSVR
jgi:hypothetical protein